MKISFKYCKKCRVLAYDEDKCCVLCSGELSKEEISIVCSCGNNLSLNQEYCGKCGEKVSDEGKRLYKKAEKLYRRLKRVPRN
jgi:predicted amidophosphoribosyltransferase